MIKDTTYTTIEQFVEAAGITAEAKMVDNNPNLPGDAADYWAANHYEVTLRRANSDQTMTVYYSMGPAHLREPEAVDVMSSLLLEATGVDGMPFEDWAIEYGYSPYSRTSKHTYNTIKAQAEELRTFLGEHYSAAQDVQVFL